MVNYHMANDATLIIDAEYGSNLENLASNIETILSNAEKHKLKIDIDMGHLKDQMSKITDVFGDSFSKPGSTGAKASKAASKGVKQNYSGLINAYNKSEKELQKAMLAAEKAGADLEKRQDRRFKAGYAWVSKSGKNDALAKNLNSQAKQSISLWEKIQQLGLENDERIKRGTERRAADLNIHETKKAFKQEEQIIKDRWKFMSDIDKNYAKGKSSAHYEDGSLVGAGEAETKRATELENAYNGLIQSKEKYGKQSERYARLTALNTTEQEKYNIAMEKLVPTQTAVQSSIEKTSDFLNNSTASAYGQTSANREAIVNNLKELQDLSSDYDKLQKNPAELGRRYNDLTSNIERNTKAIVEGGEASSTFGSKFGAAFKKYAQYFGVSRIILSATRAMKQMATESINVESAMNRIQIVTGASDAEMSSFYETASSQAQELGKSITDVAGSIETFSRLGYSLKDASELSKYATIMSNVGDVDVSAATTGITSIIKGYNMDASDAEHVSDVLVNVGKKYAISAEELMQAFERGGAALSASGTDFEKSAALFAATNASLQNAQTTGTMWKTVSARIRGAKSELEEMGEDTSDLAEGFSKNREELEALTGVDIMKNETEYKDLYTIFTELAHVWDDINGDPARARVAEILGGTRQLSGIMSTINNIKDAEGAYKDAMDSAGVSARSNEKHMETTAASLGKLKATFQDFSSDFMSSSFLKGAVDTGNTLLTIIDKIATAIGGGKMAAGIGAIAAAIIQIRGASKDIAKAGQVKSVTNVLSNAFPKLSNSLKNMKSAFNAAKDYGQGNIGASLSAIRSLPTMVKAIGAVGVGIAAYKTFDYINSGWTRAQENASNAREEFEKANKELEETKEQRMGQVSQAKEIAAKYDVDVSGLETVDEVINKIESSDKGITLVDQVELDKLSSANSELETELKIRQQIADAKKEASQGRTELASRKEQSYWEHLKEKHGVIKGAAEYIYGLGTVDIYDNGNIVPAPEMAEWDAGDKSNIGIAESTLKDLKKQKKELNKINNIEGNLTEDQIKRRNELNESIAETSSYLSDYIDAVSTEAETLSGSDSKYAQEFMPRAKALLKDYRQMDMSPAEKIKDNLDTFFSDNDSLKNYLSDASGSATKLEAALKNVGLSISDLGIENINQLKQYFDEATGSANKASKATESFRKNVSDIEKATESENQDKDWNTVQSAYNTAREMLKQGKTGTDDFQVMAQFLSDKNIAKMAKKAGKTGSEIADVYEKSFRGAMATADRWFNEDEDKATDNFIADMQNKGLFSKDLDEMGHWKLDAQFDNTADAAKKFGVSVGAVETMLKSLEAYGYDFSGVKKSGEMLDEYRQNLDKLKQTYDSMDEGEAKDRLGKMISGFESEYGKYEKDLSKLDEDHIVRIKFEYDLATLQNDIDHKLREIDNNGGATNPENSARYAEVITKQQDFEERFNKETGLGRKGVEMPIQFKFAEDEQKRLYKDLENTTDANERVKIQAEIANQGQIKDKIRTEISNEHPEIKPEVDVDEVNEKLNQFSSDHDYSVIELKGEVDLDDVNKTVEKYQGSTVQFKAEVDGKDIDVSATEKDGVIHYKSMVDDRELVLNKDGTLTYKVNDSEPKSWTAPPKEGTATYTVNDSAVRSYTPPGKTGTVTYNVSEASKRHRPASQGGNGPVNGTAYKGRTTSFADGSWGTKDSGTALGGELGTELLVRDGHWYTIGDNGAEFFKYKKDDIIFNADQTEQLFKKGKITYGNTRGIAYAQGTAFHKGPKKGGSTSPKTGSSSSSNDKKSKKKAKTAMEKFQAWFDKLFDWIEIRLDRQQKKIDRSVHKAERATKSGRWIGKDGDAKNPRRLAAQDYYESAISQSKTQIRNAGIGKRKYDAQARAVLNKAYNTKNKKGKRLISKKLMNSIIERDANGTLDISSYSKNVQEIIKDYQSWKDKARDAADKIRELSENIVDYYKEIAAAYKETAERSTSLLRQKSGNASSASGKNSFLEQTLSNYDTIVQKDKEAIAGLDKELSSSKSSVANASRVTAGGKKFKKLKKKKRTAIQNDINKAVNAAKKAASAGKAVPSSALNTLFKYYNAGYISSSFYDACIRYNSLRTAIPDAKAELQAQLAEDEQNAIAEKISTGSEMVENVENEQQRNIRKLELAGANYTAMEDALTKQRNAIRAAIDRNKELKLWAEDTPELLEKENDVLELENKIAQLAYDKIESDLDLLDSIAAYNKSLADLKEAQSKDLTASDYLTQIDDNNKKIAKYQQQASKALDDLKEAMKNPNEGFKGKTADEYEKLYKSALENINSLRAANEELKDSLRDDVYWRTFERAHDKAQRLLDVVSEIADLISEDMYFRDGNLTSFGAAQIANLTKQYELAREEVQNYSNDIRNLNYLYDQGEYEAEEYKEKLAELQSGLLDSAKNMKGYIDDIISMYKDLDQAELDSLFKLIDKRNDALNAKKEYYDYDKTIRGKTKDIQELTAQIAALEGVNTAEAKAQRAKLQEQLSEAQEDLEDTERDHYFSMMQDALSDMKDTLQEQFDDKWEYLSQDLTKISNLIAAANDLATTNADRIERTLTDLLSFYGINAGETGVDEAYKRHAAGSRRIRSGHIGLSSERGNEIIVTKNGIISHFNPGDGIVPADLTERLYNLAQSVKPGSSLGRPNIGKISPSSGITINQNYDSMLNIEGSADAATVSDLKRMSKDLLEKSYDYTSKRIQHDYTRTGGLRRA